MRPPKSISVEFRQGKTRADDFTVQVKRDRTIEIGPLGHDVSFRQPGENLPLGWLEVLRVPEEITTKWGCTASRSCGIVAVALP